MSKKIAMSFLTALIILFLFTSCNKEQDIFSSVIITGDVENQYTLESYSEEFEWNQIEKKDIKYKGVLLKDLVNKSNPISDNFSILLMGQDGLMAKLNGNELDDCYIVNNEKGWCSVTFNHPVNSNIKGLESIVIINNIDDIDNSVNIISNNKNIFSITPGNFLLTNYKIYNYLDGETSVDQKNDIMLYKQKKVIPLNEITNNINRILVMTRDGGYYYLSKSGYIQLDGNKINFIIPEERIIYNDIVGVLINPPQTTVMDTYYDAEYYLKKNEKVMIVFVDGFGYHQYKYAMENGYAPYLTSLNEAKIANTIYRPVTNAGYAAMITGKPPKENGIKDRDGRQPLVPTIFERALELDKKAMLVESYSCAVNTGITPILSLDDDGDKYTDDEVFDNAKIALKENPDLILVHFHGVDDAGHCFGDFDNRTMEKIKEVDSYVKEISSNWDGKIILTADHGMHKKGDEGTHGFFRYEDIIIPYLIYN